MPRFKSNRWWTLILALSVGFAYVGATATHAKADAHMFDDFGQKGWGSGGGGLPPPPGAGDPDIPMSSLKRALPMSGSRTAAGISTGRVEGDGMPVGGVMMWHFRVVLQSLRLWGLVRF